MICQAYRNNKKEKARDQNYESVTYEYETMSYDFKQYISYDNESQTNNKGFEYNESICNSIEVGDYTERKPLKVGVLGKKFTQHLLQDKDYNSNSNSSSDENYTT
jgi:hypothetical protein